MKKILSMLLVVAMLISTVIVMAVPAAAVDGEWSVYSSKDDDLLAEEGEEVRSVAGYQYTEEGLKIVPADWKDWSPYVTAQTTGKIDIRDGVYMQIRIDEFSYEADDKVFAFNVWDSQNASITSCGDDLGYGVSAMIKPSLDYDAETGEGGRGINSLQWFRLLEAGEGYTHRVYDASDEAKNSVQYDDEGRPIYTFEIKWNSTDEIYEAYLNGMKAPDKFINAMGKHFANGKAYVGFTAMNNKLNGTAGFTILKFGTSEATATTPVGDDSRLPENTYKEIAEIADPDTVEVGQPAILITGDKYSSDLKMVPSKGVHGSIVNTTDDGAIRLMANNALDGIVINVKNNVSYDIKDFPVVMVLTRNFCTCVWGDYDDDGEISEEEKECSCGESVAMYPLMGDLISAADANKINKLDVAFEWYKVYNEETEQNDSFLYFYKDLSLDERFEGRINGVRVDFSKIAYTEGRGTFDICMVGCFRTVADAEAFIEDYIVDNFGELIVEEPIDTDPIDTDPADTDPADTDPADTDPADTDPADTDPADTGDDENTTEKKSEQTTEKKPDSNNNNNKPKDEGGCGSVAGIGAIAVVAMAAAGMVSFRKKED